MKDFYNMFVVLLLLAILGVQMYVIFKKKEDYDVDLFYGRKRLDMGSDDEYWPRGLGY